MSSLLISARRRRWRRQLRESLRPWPNPPRPAFAAGAGSTGGCIEAAMSYLNGRARIGHGDSELRRTEVTGR